MTGLLAHLHQLGGPGGPVEVPGSCLVIAGCSARKAITDRPLPALQIYEGGCAPHLHTRVGPHPALRDRVRFLSAEHGLLRADTPIASYDRRLDPARVTVLRPTVRRQLHEEFGRHGVPSELLVIVEPLYLVLLADLLCAPGRPAIHWIHDPHDWAGASAVLDEWGW